MTLKTYVINMEKDVEKRLTITNQLQHLNNLQWELFKACEGKKLSEAEKSYLGYAAFKEKFGRRGTLPAFGCSVSHLRIYQDIINNHIPVALILEDDALLCSVTEAACIEIAHEITQSPEPVAVLLTPDFIYRQNDFKKELRIDNHYAMRKVVAGYMTSGYLINLSGATLLSKNLFPVKYIADCWSDFISMGLSLYGVTPHIISFPDGIGEIGRSQINMNTSPLLRFRHLLGRMKGKIQYGLSLAKGYKKSQKYW